MEDRLRDAHRSEFDQCFLLSGPLRVSCKNLKELIDKTKYLIKRISEQRSMFTNFLWQQGEM